MAQKTEMEYRKMVRYQAWERFKQERSIKDVGITLFISLLVGFAVAVFWEVPTTWLAIFRNDAVMTAILFVIFTPVVYAFIYIFFFLRREPIIIYNEQENNKEKFQESIKDLQNEIIELKKRPTSVKMDIKRLVDPHIPPHERVGINIQNNEHEDITDIRIKLVKATDWEFSEETAQGENVKWDIPEDNCYFDLGENMKVEAGNERPFYFAAIRNKDVVFLLNGGVRLMRYREKQIQPGYYHWFVTCEIEFEIYGRKKSGDSFKERYFAVIESQRMEVFANAKLDDSTSIDMREEIIHIQQEEEAD